LAVEVVRALILWASSRMMRCHRGLWRRDAERSTPSCPGPQAPARDRGPAIR